MHYLLSLASDFLCKLAKKSFKYTEFPDGIIINGDCMNADVLAFVKQHIGNKKIALFNFDPPYGHIVSDEWDKTTMNQQEFADWMMTWTKMWWPLLANGGAYYCWGGIGKPKFRPYFLYLAQAEQQADMDITLANYITWSKRRGYGTQKNYLFTREELAYFVKAKDNSPRVFNVPLTDKLRGYEGFSDKYPALSPYLRRTNVWSIKELFSGKYHSCQKPLEVCEIPIKTNTKKGEWVLDIFAGSGATGFAARNLGRKFILIEQDPNHYNNIVMKMKKFKMGDDPSKL